MNKTYWFDVIDRREDASMLGHFETKAEFPNDNLACEHFFKLMEECKSGAYRYLCSWGECDE